MSDLTELLEKVRAATGPDRELDGDIALAFGFPPTDLTRRDDGWLWYKFIEPDDFATWEAPPYTASIDAALALTERMLPGCGIVIDREPPAKGGAAAGAAVNGWIGSEGPEGRAWEHFDAIGPTFPLAILAALLAALTAQEGHDNA